ncbi:MAG: hypothetical protein IMW93_06540 [Thermoanaerobacteraceae bacterium]|nr:hypothetical protein [Desulfofundulus thermobenzoicus]MBE3588197.1 hypothetical protein [Thermoanaerobacteraceae bacterium]
MTTGTAATMRAFGKIEEVMETLACKHRTIEQLIRLLRKKGKEITAEYR